MFILLLLLTIPGFILYVKITAKTYTITPEKLTSILLEIDPLKIKKYYEFRNGINAELVAGRQFNNGIPAIECFDKNGQATVIKVNRNSQVRISKKGGAKQICYFDSCFIIDNFFYGSKTHFARNPLPPVPLDEIIKVEFQFRGSDRI